MSKKEPRFNAFAPSSVAFKVDEGNEYEFVPHQNKDSQPIGNTIIKGSMNYGMTTMVSYIAEQCIDSGEKVFIHDPKAEYLKLVPCSVTYRVDLDGQDHDVTISARLREPTREEGMNYLFEAGYPDPAQGESIKPVVALIMQGDEQEDGDFECLAVEVKSNTSTQAED